MNASNDNKLLIPDDLWDRVVVERHSKLTKYLDYLETLIAAKDGTDFYMQILENERTHLKMWDELFANNSVDKHDLNARYAIGKMFKTVDDLLCELKAGDEQC